MNNGDAGLGLKIAIGGGTLVLLRGIDQLVGVVSVTILARLLAPEAFGLVALGTTLSGLVQLFTELGLDIGLIRDRDADRSDYDTAWTLQVLAGVGVAAIMVVVARPGAIFFRDPRVEMVVYALAVSKLVESLANIRIVDFRKDLQFDREFRFMLAVRLISASATIACALVWRSYWVLVVGIFLRSAIATVLGYILVPYSPRLTLERFAKAMSFSRWLVLRGLVVGLNDRVANLILGRFVSVESLAFYNLGSEINGAVVGGLHAPARRALYPGYAKIGNDRRRLGHAYVEVFSILVLVGLPLVLAIALLGPQIVVLLLGEKWAATGPLLQVLCIAGIFRCFNTGGGLVYLVRGRPQISTAMATFRLCALVPVLYLAAKNYGVSGVAWAVALLAGVFLAVEMTIETRFVGVGFKTLVAACWRTIAAAVVMGAAVHIVQGIVMQEGGFVYAAVGIVLATAIGAAVYIAALLGLWMASGQPQGPETTAVTLARQIVRSVW